MFTGLIEEIGLIRRRSPFAGGVRFEIEAPRLAPALSAGDSVACHGLCLTVERLAAGGSGFTVAAITESLRRSTARDWRRGDRLHLEPALRAENRLGGHLVQGHVDGLGRVVRAGREGRETVLALQIPPPLRRYLVAKGSLAVDGVSLTVGAVRGGVCRLFIIPKTLACTLLGNYRPGRPVNLEVDLVAKYVESLSARGAIPGRGTG
ncbi:MAG: riboflavin synthase [Candidatus Eisenbacteria sp.]|nr:riboflavin synthase [Candidatus Eisenbacteria bacterium]